MEEVGRFFPQTRHYCVEKWSVEEPGYLKFWCTSFATRISLVILCGEFDLHSRLPPAVLYLERVLREPSV